MNKSTDSDAKLKGWQHCSKTLVNCQAVALTQDICRRFLSLSLSLDHSPSRVPPLVRLEGIAQLSGSKAYSQAETVKKTTGGES